MRKALILFCIFYVALATTDQQWNDFKHQHGKTYQTMEEEQKRYGHFVENLQLIENHNKLYEMGEETYQMGVNKFADLSQEDLAVMFKRQSQLKPVFKATTTPTFLDKPDLPNATDWREVGAVTRVKEQGSCASCWAFSVTGNLESFWFLRHNELIEFSEQQLVDCDTANTGCAGGEEAPAMAYFVKYGIQTEESYPYVGAKQTCQYNESSVYAELENYITIEPGDESTVEIVVGFLGPCSVALDGTGLSFYSSGIFTSSTCSNTTTNHAVLAVGYGYDEDTDLDYWIVKNSWGENWGESGYFRIKKGSNECAIAMDSVYPSFAPSILNE